MNLHVFRGAGGHHGITTEQSGDNLPADGAPWSYLKPLSINEDDGPRIGANSAEIVQAVRRDGYFLLPAGSGEPS